MKLYRITRSELRYSEKFSFFLILIFLLIRSTYLRIVSVFFLLFVCIKVFIPIVKYKTVGVFCYTRENDYNCIYVMKKYCHWICSFTDNKKFYHKYYKKNNVELNGIITETNSHFLVTPNNNYIRNTIYAHCIYVYV